MSELSLSVWRSNNCMMITVGRFHQLVDCYMPNLFAPQGYPS